MIIKYYCDTYVKRMALVCAYRIFDILSRNQFMRLIKTDLYGILIVIHILLSRGDRENYNNIMFTIHHYFIGIGFVYNKQDACASPWARDEEDTADVMVKDSGTKTAKNAISLIAGRVSRRPQPVFFLCRFDVSLFEIIMQFLKKKTRLPLR